MERTSKKKKEMKKTMLYAALLMQTLINTQCTSSHLPNEKHYRELFCSLEISYIDTLFSNVYNVMFRSSNYRGDRNTFLIEFVDSNKIIIIKDSCSFYYREFQSTNQKLSTVRPLPFDWKYPVNPPKIISIINFCLENYIYEISIRGKSENNIYFKTQKGTFYYTNNKAYTENAENLCGNWYFMN